MLGDQFGVDVIIPCIPEVQRTITSELFPGVVADLEEGDEDESGAVGGDEIAM